MTDLGTLVLAHRYLYYVLSTPVISDHAYDELEARLPTDHPVRQMVGAAFMSAYPREAVYLAESLLSGASEAS